MEEVVAQIMKTNKATRLFQTTAIVSLNMGNLTLGINTMKNRLVMGEKEKAVSQEELAKERDFQNWYEHNVEIWMKNRAKVELKNKVFIKKLQNENEELKGSIAQLKSQDEKMKNLRQKVEIWETGEKKWTEALFLHKR